MNAEVVRQVSLQPCYFVPESRSLGAATADETAIYAESRAVECGVSDERREEAKARVVEHLAEGMPPLDAAHIFQLDMERACRMRKLALYGGISAAVLTVVGVGVFLFRTRRRSKR